MTQKYCMIGFAAVFGMAAAALGQTGTADSYTLRPVYKAGAAEQYKTVIDVEQQSAAGKITSEFTLSTTETARSVNPDGTVTLVTHLDSGAVKSLNGEIKLADVDDQVAITDKDGRSVDGPKPGDPPQKQSVLLLLDVPRMVIRPDHPLHVGEAYRYDYSTGDKGGQRFVGTVTVVGIVKRSAAIPVDALQVHNVGDITVGAGTPTEAKRHLDTMSLIDPSDYHAVSVEGKLVIPGAVAGAAPTNMTFKRSRVFSVGH